MKITFITFGSIALISLPACSSNNRLAASLGVMPSGISSEYFHKQSAGFIIESKRPGTSGDRIVRYAMLFIPIKPSDRAFYLRTRFENPADSSQPLVIDSVLQPDSKKFAPNSPPVHGLEVRHGYKVELLIFDSSDRTHEIGRHIQYVRFL